MRIVQKAVHGVARAKSRLSSPVLNAPTTHRTIPTGMSGEDEFDFVHLLGPANPAWVYLYAHALHIPTTPDPIVSAVPTAPAIAAPAPVSEVMRAASFAPLAPAW